MSWYIADIDIIGVVSHQRFRYRFLIYRYHIDDKWNIAKFSIFYHTFPDFLTLTKTWVKLSIISFGIGNLIPLYISTSLKRKLRNNIDIIEYFVGDNEVCQ